MAHPPTIHDFGGGLQRLFEIQYPAPGDPELAGHISAALKPLEVTLDHSWGLDHEAWAVLRKAYPDPDVPVLQLSVDMTRGPQFHFEVGKRLETLRDEGILILGSGNIVHNLAVFRRFEEGFAYLWAVEFNDYIRNNLMSGKFKALVDYEKVGMAAPALGSNARSLLPYPLRRARPAARLP
jgi:4,5-DOPA dioxygenase extradiol